MAYDDQNVFAKILRGEIPCNKVYEDEHTLAFHDINPQAPTHVLVIPKGPYEDLNAFAENASEVEKSALVTAVAKVADQLGLVEKGYRTLVNSGLEGGQEVPHLHYHIFGGKPLGPMLAK